MSEHTDLIGRIRADIQTELARCGVAVKREGRSVNVRVGGKIDWYDVDQPLPPIVRLWDEAVMSLTIERAKRIQADTQTGENPNPKTTEQGEEAER